MTHHTVEASAPDAEIPPEFVFSLEAIDPTTGDPVAGVSVADVVIYAEDLGAGGLTERIVPTLTSEEVEGL